jgi:hypothetical protein
MMANLEFGIQECSKCQYKMRCDECVYNKKDIEKTVNEAVKDEVKGILQIIKDELKYSWTKSVDYVYESIKERYGVEVK